MDFYSHPNKKLLYHLKEVRDYSINKIPSKLKNSYNIIALTHDFGKYTSYFQKYLTKGSKSDYSNHGFISAVYGAYIGLKTFGEGNILPLIIYNVVLHHHGNLENFSEQLPNSFKENNKTNYNINLLQKIEIGYKQIEVGTGEYFKSGTRKGQEKTKKEIIQGTPDMWEAELQLNHYRTFVEAAGFPVKQMYIEAIVRDGGTFSAANRGIKENVYLISIKKLPDDEVKSYFKTKSTALLKALNEKILPERCSDLENWDGRKCKGYCIVADYCDYGRKLKEADKK